MSGVSCRRSFWPAFAFHHCARRCAPRVGIPSCPCSLLWAAMPCIARASFPWAGRARQARRSHEIGVSCSRAARALRSPPCGPRAPPVRRRRRLGGVRVIHVLHGWVVTVGCCCFLRSLFGGCLFLIVVLPRVRLARVMQSIWSTRFSTFAVCVRVGAL